MKNFTYEEVNLMALYNTGSRERLIEVVEGKLPDQTLVIADHGDIVLPGIDGDYPQFCVNLL